jgi:hypothetical protein
LNTQAIFTDDSICSVTMPCPPPSVQAKYPRSAYDLYTPRFTKGVGRTKEGICPICFESKERGGEGRVEWLSMKFSAYKL